MGIYLASTTFLPVVIVASRADGYALATLEWFKMCKVRARPSHLKKKSSLSSSARSVTDETDPTKLRWIARFLSVYHSSYTLPKITEPRLMVQDP